MGPGVQPKETKSPGTSGSRKLPLTSFRFGTPFVSSCLGRPKGQLDAENRQTEPVWLRVRGESAQQTEIGLKGEIPLQEGFFS